VCPAGCTEYRPRARRVGRREASDTRRCEDLRVIDCEIEETELEGVYGMVPRVRARCSRCGHETETFGTGETSIMRCLALMREECPAEETNLYVEDATLRRQARTAG
jgi:hypothetical protein